MSEHSVDQLWLSVAQTVHHSGCLACYVAVLKKITGHDPKIFEAYISTDIRVYEILSGLILTIYSKQYIASPMVT